MSESAQALTAEFFAKDNDYPRFALVAPRVMSVQTAKLFFGLMQQAFSNDDERFQFQVKFISATSSDIGLVKRELWEFLDAYGLKATAMFEDGKPILTYQTRNEDYVMGLLDELEEFIVFVTMKPGANDPIMTVYIGSPSDWCDALKDTDETEASSSSSSSSSNESEQKSKKRRKKSKIEDDD